MKSDPAVSSIFTGAGGSKGLPNYIPDATRFGAAAAYPPGTAYLGFYMAAFPYAWSYSGGVASGAQSGPTLSRVNGLPQGSPNASYMTYRMQFKDPNTNAFVTYDTKYGKVSDGTAQPAGTGGGSLSPAYTGGGVLFPVGGLDESGYWASVTDPRTARFGFQWNGISNGPGDNNAVFSGGLMDSVFLAGWIDTANGIMKTNRPDAQSGFYFMNSWTSGGTARGGMPAPSSGWMAWASSDNATFAGLAPGLLAQNNADIYYSPSRAYKDNNGAYTHTPNYFADPDGIVRRGMGAFVPLGTSSSPSAVPGDSRTPSADTTVGLPTARVFGSPPAPNSPTIINYGIGSNLSQAQSRPYFLHRPFRSVAELGCVFSDTPWRNLDFFTSESGDTALLDVFCISDSDNPAALVAGKVNLNTAQTPVLTSILAGASLDIANVTGNNAVTAPMAPTTAGNVASALRAYTTGSNGLLQNVGELVGRWVSPQKIKPLGSLLTGTDKGQLGVSPNPGAYYDGKLCYIGFSGGQWDSVNHKPQITTPAADVYSAYMNAASSFTSTTNHNGTQEAAAYIQRMREAPIRALAACGQTRVWNLMIDVVAQTGRYPAGATALDKFLVEGEQRYWVHVAIDRYTGKVIDKQIEAIKE